MKMFLIAGVLMAAAVPALAQTAAPSDPKSVVSPPATPPGTFIGGSPANANSGPGSTGSISTEGTGAGTISNNPAKDGNAEQPERAVPNAGSTK